MRGPVDHEQPTELNVKTKFLLHLSGAGLVRCLSGVDVPAGDVPVVLVYRPHEHDAATVVEEQGASRDVWAAAVVWIVGHGPRIWVRRPAAAWQGQRAGPRGYRVRV